MAKTKAPVFGWLAISTGSVGLLLAVFHFAAGPFDPPPTIGDSLAQSAAEIADATIALFSDEEPVVEETPLPGQKDRLARIVAAMLAAVAMVLAAVAHGRGESPGPASGGAALGAAAIIFQLSILSMGA